MKKKLTMLVAGLLPAMMITAQEPVVVSGDVHVGTSAVLSSKGSVGLRSGDDSNKAMIVNKGTLKLNGGVSFHSTDDYTGVLLNKYADGGTVELAGSVSVRKTFKMDSQDPWYYISFPFDVKLSDLRLTKEGETFDPTHMAVQVYNAKNRAEFGSVGSGSANWESVDMSGGILKANMGYILAVGPNNAGKEIEFPAASGYDLPGLYPANGKKEVTLNYYTSPNTRDKDWGWNYIGNPHTSNFRMDQSTIGRSSVIYLWVGANYQAEVLDFGGIVIRPLTPFLIQAKSDGNLVFMPDGLTDESPYDGLRSATNPGSLIKLKLTGSDFGFDSYSLILNGETNDRYDAVKLFSPIEGAPQLWAEVGSESYSLNRVSFNGLVEIPLHVQLGSNPEGSLSLSDIRNLEHENISLVNLSDGSETDLLKGDVCTISGSNSTGRYLLRIGTGSTGTYSQSTGSVSVCANENRLIVSGIAEKDHILVYNASGLLIAERKAGVSEEIFSLPEKGVYIVKVSGTSFLIKKVINR